MKMQSSRLSGLGSTTKHIPPLPANSMVSQNFTTLCTAAEVAAMKAGTKLVKLELTRSVEQAGGRILNNYYIYVPNVACFLYQANPSAYPTVAALNAAAIAQWQKNNAPGTFEKLMEKYVVPGVEAIVLIGIGGSFITSSLATPAAAAPLTTPAITYCPPPPMRPPRPPQDLLH